MGYRNLTTSFVSPLAAAIIAGFILYRYSSNTSRRKLPPGPKGLPLIGNVRDFPPAGVAEFEHWLKHKNLYGPISSVTALGTTLVLIHDAKAAVDLLERTASTTSGRPSIPFAGEICGYGQLTPFQEYGSTFRLNRKIIHQAVGTKRSAMKLADQQDIEVGRQLVRGLDDPERWIEHLKRTSGGTALKIAFGYNAEPYMRDDALIMLTERMLEEFQVALAPNTWAVDFLPILRYLPESFPGASFKETARRYRKTLDDVVTIPYRFVQRQMAANTHRESYTSRLRRQFMKDGEVSPEDEAPIMWTAATLYGAATDTTFITLTAFTAAMTMFPDVQRKAQAEIDRVIGTDRLPNADDRDSLPYVNAVIQESLRWWPVTPLGFLHMATEDVEFNGLHIPKGSGILPAVWWFLHDPEVYEHPESFDPERFLAPRDEPDPSRHAFGYGRRICPGRFLADMGLYFNISQTLACFNIGKAVDASGKEIDVDVKPTPGFLCYVPDFPFQVTPRDQEHVDVIRRFQAEHPLEKGDAHLLEVMSA